MDIIQQLSICTNVFQKDDTITKPTGNLIYNFTNETLTPLVNLNGWTQIIPDGETQLYVIGGNSK